MKLYRNKSFRFLVTVLAGVLLASSGFAQNSVVNDTFQPGPGKAPGSPLYVPTKAEKAFRYWYTTTPDSWVWQGSEEADADFHVHPLHARFVRGSHKLMPWIHRNLTSEGTSVKTGQTVSNPTLRVDTSMVWGGDEDPSIGWMLALVDNQGRGYAAEIARSGKTTLFRVDESLTESDGWIQIGSGQSEPGNRQLLSLAVNNGQVRVGTSQRRGAIVSIADKTYEKFSGIALSSVSASGVFIVVHSVTLSGDVR